MPVYDIAGIFIEINAPAGMLHGNFEAFRQDRAHSGYRIDILREAPPEVPESARLVARTHVQEIYENDGLLYFRHDDEDVPPLVTAGGGCRSYVIYTGRDPYKSGDADSLVSELARELRDIAGMIISQNRGFLIHSASIEYNGMGVLFSAVSGTGKSTQAHLWQQCHGVRILDGDVNACRLIGGKPYIFGLPWCGTSGEFLYDSVPLKAIVFLEQAKENTVEKLDLLQSVLRLSSRCFLPFVRSADLTGEALDTVEEVASSADCYLLRCLPDYGAVEMLRRCLDT